MTDETLSVERIFNRTTSWEPLLSIPAATHKLAVGEAPGDDTVRVGRGKRSGWRAVYLLDAGQEFARPLRGH